MVSCNFIGSHSVTRGNRYKLTQKHVHYSLTKFSCANRVVSIWNSLPGHVVSASYLHLCPVFLTSHPSRSSSSSPMVRRRPIMSVESSLTARRLYTLTVCAFTARVIRHCRSSSGRSSLPSYSMSAVLGGASPIKS